MGIERYNYINKEPLEKWKEVFNTPFRKFYLKRYIRKLDKRVLLVQGYDKQDILKECDSLKLKHKYFFRDIACVFYSFLVRKMHSNLFLGRTKKWARDSYLG